MKRATIKNQKRAKEAVNFNPRPREEGDDSRRFFCTEKGDFNPRPREEGDIFLVTFLGIVCYFNPRPREEGDS